MALTATLCLLGAETARAAAGEVLSHQKISSIEGGLVGPIQNGDTFGRAVGALGDLDGDGVNDVVVGADGDQEGGVTTGAVYVLFLNADGTVKAEQKINGLQGGFGGTLSAGDDFGSGFALLGDLDRDGRPELAVTSDEDDDGGGNRGAVWILSLNPDGTVFAEQKISDTAGGFTGGLTDGDVFGYPGRVGDLDGDGITELAVGAPAADDGFGNAGEVWILFLNADGTVKNQQKISATSGGLTGPLAPGDQFGISVDGLGDVDGDGVPDLVVGAFGDDTGGPSRGALYVLFLNPDGTVKAEQKIASGTGGFTGVLDDGDFLGIPAERLGDVDGDGVVDIATGAYGDDDGGSAFGALWVLFLNANGTVKGHQKISATAGNFTATLTGSDFFGVATGALGDVDGDGITDLGAGAWQDDEGGPNQGAAYVIQLEGQPIVCGDGVLDPLETCDDGGTTPGDGCSATCQEEYYDLLVETFTPLVSHPAAYVVGTDVVTTEITLGVSLDDGEAPQDYEVRFDLVAHTTAGVPCTDLPTPAACAAAGTAAVFELATELVPAGHLDARPSYPGAPLGDYQTQLQLSGALNQDGSLESFEDWRTAHLLKDNHFRVRAVIDPADAIPEFPGTGETNNEAQDATPYQTLPLTGSLFFDTQETDIVSVSDTPGACPVGQIFLNSITYDWTPSPNSFWNVVQITETPPVPACSTLTQTTGGPGLDVDAAFSSIVPSHLGTLGGLDIEIQNTTLGPGPGGGAFPGTAIVTLPEGHSLHEIEPVSGLPEPRGVRQLTFVAPGGPVADFGTLSFVPPATLLPGYLHVAGLPVSNRYSAFQIAEPIASGTILEARYVHDLPYATRDNRHPTRDGVTSNDRRYQIYNQFVMAPSFTLDGAGLDVSLPFEGSPGTGDAPTHFPRTRMDWSNFTLQIVDGAVVAGASIPPSETYAFRQNPACADCPADSAQGPEYEIAPSVAQGISADGAVFALAPSIGKTESDFPVWGPYDTVASQFVFERPNDSNSPGVFLLPGFRVPGSGGEDGPGGPPVSVAGSLLGMRAAVIAGSSIVPGTLHRRGSYEASRGNHFMAGITVGPELYRGSFMGQPEAGVGTVLTGKAMDVGFGGLNGPSYETVIGNAGNKYVVRPGGVTGVFNTSTPPNPSIYGYAFSLHRFAFRQVSNTLDPNTWIDGQVVVPQPGDFTIAFESLDLLCTGDIREGLVVRESCDGSDSNQNGIPDENCFEELGAWRTTFEILSMTFVPPGGAAICDPGDREMEVGSVVDLVALEEEIGLTSRWSNQGEPSNSTFSGKTKQSLDDPGLPDEPGFELLLGSDVELARKSDTSGWFRFHGSSIPLPFWDAMPVGLRVQNATTTSQMQSIVGEESEGFLNDTGRDNTDIAGAGDMKASNALFATYTWGATGFSISLPVHFEIGNFGANAATSRLLGKTVSKSLVVLDATAGTDFITPTETKISFGASAQFDNLQFSDLPLNIDLSDPSSMLKLDSFLGGSLVQDIAGSLAGSVNGMNDVIGNNLDGFIEDGIFGAIDTELANQGGAAFDDLATALTKIQGVPGQLVEQVATEIEGLNVALTDPLTPIAEQRLDTLIADLPTLLDDAQSGGPDPVALQDALETVDDLLGVLDAVQQDMDDVNAEIDQARDNIRGASNTLLSAIQTAKGDGINASGAVVSLVDDAIGLGGVTGCNGGNPVITQITEIGDRVRDVQEVLEAIDLEAIGDAISSFAEVDLSTVAQAETEIQNLAKDIADGITQATNTVNGVIGCGGTLPYGTFGDDLLQFDTDLQSALGTIDTELETVLDTLLGDELVPADTGQLGLVTAAIQGGLGDVAAYRGPLEDVRGALVSALGASPAYEFPSGTAVDIQTWLLANLENGGVNLIGDLRQGLTNDVTLAIDLAAFTAATGLSVSLTDLNHPTGPDVHTHVTDLLMNDGLIEQADAEVSLQLTSLVDKTNGIQLLVFDQINGLIRSMIAEQDGVLANLLANENSIVEGNGSEWNMPTFQMDGWALIQGDDLQQLHVGFDLSVPGQEDKDSFSLSVSLDVTRWTANGKDQGCAFVDAASRLDVVIAAYDIPFRIGASEANIRKVYFGFTLQEAGGAIYPVQGFGGIAVDGALDFQVVKVIDPAFVFGAGDVEVYIGASATATFDTTSISVAFLIGRICNNEPLLTIDPQAGEFIDFPASGGFTGGYVRGSASTVIISYGCPLEIGAGVDVGNWLFLGPPTVAGGIVGGGIFGKAACIVSIRGQVTILIGFEGTLANFGGEMFFVGGLGLCSPSGWTTVPKSRGDDIFCGTIDASIGASATVDLEALFDGAGAGAIDYEIEEPEFGAIH